MNAPYDPHAFLELLRDEHAQLLERFTDFSEAVDAPLQQRIADELCEALELHLRLEDELLHPIAARLLQDTRAEPAAIRGDIEHAIVRDLIGRLGDAYAGEAPFLATLAVLEATVISHVQSEEDDLFPHLDGRIPQRELAMRWHERRGQLAGLADG
jgi:hypothetical protein